jgi:hypothetical protein
MFRLTVIMSWHVPDIGEMENAYRISVRSLGVKSAGDTKA